jgi:hypothetical protein
MPIPEENPRLEHVSPTRVVDLTTPERFPIRGLDVQTYKHRSMSDGHLVQINLILCGCRDGYFYILNPYGDVLYKYGRKGEGEGL